MNHLRLDWIALVAALLLHPACSNDDVKTYRIPKEEVPPPPANVDTPASPELTWSAPDDWVEAPPAQMRLVSFQLPSVGEQAECYIVVLGGQGGTLEGNVNRWRNQLGLGRLDPAAVEDQALVHEGSHGRYRYFRIANPAQPDQAFLVAILPLDGRTAFVKLSAPLASLETVEDDFLAFCSSVSHG